jgi:DNA repair photolyase
MDGSQLRHGEQTMVTPFPPEAPGRGSQQNPNNRFAAVQLERELDYLEFDDDAQDEFRTVRTRYYPDATQSIVAQNNSPDVPFNYSINPYRGCAHGCSYCYARPTHEYLGLGAGLDFESKILVKLDAARLFRSWLCRDNWIPEPIAFSGVTDCYQPAERHFRLTRACLEVALEARQPVMLITKNALITRDIDLLAELAKANLVRVAFSMTTLDQSLTRVLEPRTSCPEARLAAIRKLADQAIPVSVMIAPIIPGLNESEIPRILEAAAAHGAESAGYVMLRLPWNVKPIFLDWLARHRPLQQKKVVSFIEQTRGGQLNDSNFGSRMHGTGWLAEQVEQMFRVYRAKFGMNHGRRALDCSQFRRPLAGPVQQLLF